MGGVGTKDAMMDDGRRSSAVRAMEMAHGLLAL